MCVPLKVMWDYNSQSFAEETTSVCSLIVTGPTGLPKLETEILNRSACLKTYNHGQKSWDKFTFVALFTCVKQTVTHEFIYTCSAPSPTPPTMSDTCTRYFSRVSTLYWEGGGRKQCSLKRITVSAFLKIHFKTPKINEITQVSQVLGWDESVVLFLLRTERYGTSHCTFHTLVIYTWKPHAQARHNWNYLFFVKYLFCWQYLRP